METSKIKILVHLYANYTTEKVMARLGLCNDSDFSLGMICGACIAYETSLSMIMSSEEYSNCISAVKEGVAKRLNLTIEKVEECL